MIANQLGYLLSRINAPGAVPLDRATGLTAIRPKPVFILLAEKPGLGFFIRP